MVLDAVLNFVRGNTDAAVGTEDTTVSVADASIFPDPATDGEYNVVVWDVNNFPRPDQDGDVEIMRVTARDTTADELTVTRGQEMTSSAAHPEGSAIHLSPTAKMFSDIESTFGDFWDAGTQELTADVNNTNTTTTALEADDLDTDYAYQAPGTRASIQSTIDAANTDGVGRVNIEAGNYDETIETNRGQLVVGAGRDDPEFGVGTAIDTSDSGPVVELSGVNSMLKHCRIENTGTGLAMALSGSASAAAWNFIHTGNVEIGTSDNIQFNNNFLNDNDITILSTTNNAVVDGNSTVGTITDNGSDSVVGDNS